MLNNNLFQFPAWNAYGSSSIGVDTLIEHLTSGSDDVIAMSADVISDIASSRRARKQIRTKGGLEILVSSIPSKNYFRSPFHEGDFA